MMGSVSGAETHEAELSELLRTAYFPFARFDGSSSYIIFNISADALKYYAAKAGARSFIHVEVSCGDDSCRIDSRYYELEDVAAPYHKRGNPYHPDVMTEGDAKVWDDYISLETEAWRYTVSFKLLEYVSDRIAENLQQSDNTVISKTITAIGYSALYNRASLYRGLSDVHPRGEKHEWWMSAEDLTNELEPTVSDGRYGYADQTGAWVIEPRFDDASEFSSDIAAVRQDGKWGYIDRKGAWVITPRYRSVFVFTGGRAWVKLSDKYGCINRAGEWVIEPGYDDVWGDEDGMTLVRVDGKYGWIDYEGAWVIEPKFDDASWFYKGRAIVTVGRRHGIITKTGEWIIGPKCEEIEMLDDHSARVIVDGKEYYIDSTGTAIAEVQ